MNAKTFARVYGSKERQKWVSLLPCCACGYLNTEQPNHNHHIQTGGTGRKADHTLVVPLCWLCHLQVHRIGQKTFQAMNDVDLDAAAARTESAWQQYQFDNQVNREKRRPGVRTAVESDPVNPAGGF